MGRWPEGPEGPDPSFRRASMCRFTVSDTPRPIGPASSLTQTRIWLLLSEPYTTPRRRAPPGTANLRAEGESLGAPGPGVRATLARGCGRGCPGPRRLALQTF